MKTKHSTYLLLTTAFVLNFCNLKAQTGWTYSSPNIYTTTGTDKVGIGTSTPLFGLQIENIISGGNISSGSTFGIGLSVNGVSAVGQQNADKHAVFGCSNANKDILFPTYNGTSFDERMRIRYDGNVGIGTASPAYLLSVVKNQNGVSRIAISNNNTGSAAYATFTAIGATGTAYLGTSRAAVLGNTAGTEVAFIQSVAVPLLIGTAQSHDLRLCTNATERVRITTSGNVGIGTPSPDIWAGGTDYRTLTILGPNTSAGSCGVIELATQSTDANGNKAGAINFLASTNASGKKSIAQIYSFTQGSTATNRGGYLAFSTKPDNATSDVERMRIDNVGNVGIGTSTPVAKLDVVTNTSSTSAIRAGNTATVGTNHGADIYAIGAGTTVNTGLIVTASGGSSNYNIWLSNMTAGPNNYSLYSPASAKSYFGGDVGIGTAAPTALLSVNGSANKVGGGTWATFCDIQLKKDTSAFKDGLSVIKKIHPIRYKYNGKAGIKDTNSTFIGVVAQQMLLAAPYTVGTFMAKLDTADTQETSLLNYDPNALLYLFVNAFKELDSVNVKKDSVINNLTQKVTHIDSMNNLLQNQLNQLLTIINNCCNNPMQSSVNNNEQTKSMGINNSATQSETAQIDIRLKDIQSIVLEQNVPNPFAEQTTISYSLPDNTGKAQMLFYNSQGKLIQSTDLIQKGGKGQLNVFASDLTNGIYTYTLMVDGQVIDSKRMVKSK